MVNLLFLFTVLFCLIPLHAADKSGVSPTTISLPKGPGSIEGLGESFQPQLNSGTARYNVKLAVPPGPAGNGPGLALLYESGGGNGVLGIGWTLPWACIQRRTDKGIPTYGADFGFPRVDTFINEGKEELVPQANGDFFCENEGSFVRYRRTNDYWIAHLPNGTLLEFGATPAARVAEGTNVFCWLLERQRDTRGNTITYAYSTFPGDHNLNQKYLTAMAYGPGAPPWINFHFVRFIYEERSDWFEDCRAGFPVRTGKRLKEIVIGSQGPSLTNHLAGDFYSDGTPDHLNRKYELRYVNYAGTNSHWSLLAEVRPVGADGASRLPSSTFGYNVCNPSNLLSAVGMEMGGINEPGFVMDNAQVDLVDLNGDGLPDILDTGGPAHQGFLNLGVADVEGVRSIRWADPMDVESSSGEAALFSLDSDDTHLADMDGDGAADLVRKSGFDDSVFYFRNLNRGRWSDRETMDIAFGALPPPAPFEEPDVRTADVDFDKRIDLIRANGIEYQIWFNFGSNTYSDRISVPQDESVDFALSGYQLADFNGDRIPDICRVRPGDIEIRAGLGYGRFLSLSNVLIADLTLDNAQVSKAKLTDITGDGLADLVIERPVPGEVWYWINLGNYTLSEQKIISDLPGGGGTEVAIRWADLNGNGSTDLVYADSFSEPRLLTFDLGELLNCGTTPNALLAISNGIGRATLIGYAPSTTYAVADAAVGRAWTNFMPNPVTVVSSVTNLDSLGHQYVSRFVYHDGFYDPIEKQFRGFARAEQVDEGDATAPTLVTRSYFDTGRDFEPMKGKLLRLTTETEDGRVFSDDTTAWAIPPRTLMTGTNGQSVYFAHPTGHTKLIKELGQGVERRLETESIFDNLGNQTTNVDYGIVVGGNRSAFDDERIVTTEYAINTNAWLIRAPKRSELKDENGVVISRAETFYDDETFSGNNLGQIIIGNATMKRDWIDPANPSRFITSMRAKYDSIGNISHALDSLAEAPGGSINLNKGHVRALEYDNRFRTYPITETVHVGDGTAPLTFRVAYDEGFGTVSESTDFNSNQTFYFYDVFARLTSMVRPGDTPAFPTVEYSYHLAVPYQGTNLVNFVETRQRDKSEIRDPKSEMYFISHQFVDGLGRSLQTRTEAEPATAGGPARVVVNGAVVFNQRLKPARLLNPFFSTASGNLDALLAYESVEASGWTGQFQSEGALVTLNLAAAHQTAARYDATLREIETINPDGSRRTNRYEPLLTRSYDENDTDPGSPHFDTPMVHANDGLGRLIRVEEITRLNDDGTSAGALRSWVTTYVYDLNDQLRFITDSQNNVKEFRYDGLKRKLFMNDPDRGVMNFVYDDASNLIESTDAKGQRITYTYDGVNRIRSEDYRDEALPFSRNFAFNTALPISATNRPDVAYFYDVPQANLDVGDGSMSTAGNVKGKLAYVWDLSGEEHASFDARERVAYTVKRVSDPLHGQLVSYRTGFTYDSLDRLTLLTYPDNDEVKYTYNERNLLGQILGGPTGSILSNLVYWPSGQQREILYGNSVRTTYAHDNRMRLTDLNTHHTARATEPLIHFVYQFDPVSNIKSIEDQRPGSVVPAGDPRRNTQLFQYDDLYRLTRAQYSFTLPNQPVANNGEITYRYDRIGNMLAQLSTFNHVEKGLPVANLGTMDSGGSAGRFGRVGRGPNDPPGPHALTSVQPSTLNSQPSTNNSVRSYSYDANGNMLVIDGLTNTWDFKDRLIRVEDTNMVADYTYDYTDRRITKRVESKR